MRSYIDKRKVKTKRNKSEPFTDYFILDLNHSLDKTRTGGMYLCIDKNILKVTN